MPLQKILFWLYLLTGIVTGIIVMIMPVTGIALTYQKQITNWANKKNLHYKPNSRFPTSSGCSYPI
ncbi:MAG: PepSY domain-containing protein [Desulfatiglans sp.]|nr:PepSY domain-containing protein [Desulfatiglans sp.]